MFYLLLLLLCSYWCKICQYPEINAFHARKRANQFIFHQFHGKYFQCDFHPQTIIKMQYSNELFMRCIRKHIYLRAENPICDANNFMIQSRFAYVVVVDVIVHSIFVFIHFIHLKLVVQSHFFQYLYNLFVQQATTQQQFDQLTEI